MKDVAGPLIKLVVFGVVTVFATALLAVTIANSGAGGDHKFSAIFTDAAMLDKGDDVRIAGVRVGQISDVEVYDRTMAKVSFNLDRNELPAGVQAYLRYKNVAGIRYLALEQGPQVAGETLSTGAVIPLAQTHPALNLTELFNGLKPLFQQLTADDVNRLSNEIIQVFQGEGGSITQLVQDTSSLTNSIADKDAMIGELITNLTKVLGAVNSHNQQFDALVDTTAKFVTGLAAQRDSVGSAIESVSNLTTVTQSVLGPTRPSIQGSISALNQLASVINQRSVDVNAALATFPVKMEKLGRSATFGSWFQFYLCGIDIKAGNGKSTLLTQPLVPLPNIDHVLYTNAATRCWANNDPNNNLPNG